MRSYSASAMRMHKPAMPPTCVAIALCHTGAMPCVAASSSAAAADQEHVGRPACRRGLQHMLCEPADESLLRTEHDARGGRAADRPARILVTQAQRLRDRLCDHIGIGVRQSPVSSAAALRSCDASARDAAHARVPDHRASPDLPHRHARCQRRRQTASGGPLCHANPARANPARGRPTCASPRASPTRARPTCASPAAGRVAGPRQQCNDRCTQRRASASVIRPACSIVATAGAGVLIEPIRQRLPHRRNRRGGHAV